MKTLHVLGTGCPSCERLAELAEQAAKDLHLDYQLEKVTDIQEITQYDIAATPALVVDGEVRVSGRVPTLEELRELIR